jgi:hypothetical protein
LLLEIMSLAKEMTRMHCQGLPKERHMQEDFVQSCVVAMMYDISKLALVQARFLVTAHAHVVA